MIYDVNNKELNLRFFYRIPLAVADTKPIPVRLNASVIKRLDTAAQRLVIDRTSIIRFCIETFLSDFEAKGRTILPPDWEQLIRDQDGRRAKASQSLVTSAAAGLSEAQFASAAMMVAEDYKESLGSQAEPLETSTAAHPPKARASRKARGTAKA